MGAICRFSHVLNLIHSWCQMAESPVIRYLAIEKKSFSFWFISTNVNSDIVDLYSIVQVTNNNQLTSNYPSQPGWDDGMATFEMTIVANNLHGDYQLANGLGPDQAMVVLTVSFIISELCHSRGCSAFRCSRTVLFILQEHRKNFITGKDFYFLSKNGINAVRIPVGWWIAYDPNPPAPFVSGSLDTLDRAFYWAQ